MKISDMLFVISLILFALWVFKPLKPKDLKKIAKDKILSDIKLLEVELDGA